MMSKWFSDCPVEDLRRVLYIRDGGYAGSTEIKKPALSRTTFGRTSAGLRSTVQPDRLAIRFGVVQTAPGPTRDSKIRSQSA